MSQVVERRLPAIYDALDSRNNKASLARQEQSVFVCADVTPFTLLCVLQLALKLIASALQKQPKSQVLRVLKAVALQRTGKDEEGLQVSTVLLATGQLAH